MTDPNTPAPDAQQPSTQPPAAPRYGEYAPAQPTAEPAQPAAPAAPSYSAPAYSAAPAYDPAAYGTAPGAPVPGKTMGIVAFVLSFFAQLIALILGIVALVQSKKAGRSNGFAIAAIIIGALALIVGILLVFAVVIPSLNAATTCLNDPTGTATMWGVNLPCEEVLKQSGR